MCVIATHHLGRCSLPWRGWESGGWRVEWWAWGAWPSHIYPHTRGLSLWTDGFRLLPFRITKMSLGFCLFDSCLPDLALTLPLPLPLPVSSSSCHFLFLARLPFWLVRSGCDLFGSHLHILLSANVTGKVFCGELGRTISSVPFGGIICHRIRTGILVIWE